MKYTVILSADARRHIRYLFRQGIMYRGEHQRLVNAMAARLTYQPTVAQGSVKTLRLPNRFNAAFELRVTPWRVLYNVDETEGSVRIEAVGYKRRERLIVEGQEVEL
jgi:mRNA-degrading endonuclease RelE of RelBE toxin-antitoxin system